MSSGPMRRVSCQDIQLVKNLIERCLQLHMNQKEVVGTLLEQAKIEPDFTELVWQQLEEENQEFFKAYYNRLMVKHQIMEFKKLLEEHVKLMHQLHPVGVASVQTTNDSHIQSVPLTVDQNQVCYAPYQANQTLKSENAQHPMAYGLSNTFRNGGGPLLYTNMPPSLSVEMSTHARRVDAPPAMLSSHVRNMPLMQGMKGGMEAGFPTCDQYMYGGDRNTLESHSGVGDIPVASFSCEPNNQPLNGPLLDADTSTFGSLGQIPRNFSLSYMTADFYQSSDILESHDRLPFFPGECQGDYYTLETIAEGLTYENLG